MSHFRQNLVTGDWIIMAPERAKRPDQLLPKKETRDAGDLVKCPFEDLKKTGNWPPLLVHPNEEKWRIVAIPNKYPALVHAHIHPHEDKVGPYFTLEGIGHHELVVTRDHHVRLDEMRPKEALRVFLFMQARYKVLAKDKCMRYTSTFFNWGPEAGASLYHPHYQVITLPIIPPDIRHSLRGSSEYFKKHQRCVHCIITRYEQKSKKRVVGENAQAIAFAPFASSRPFEVRIFPKRHLPDFEETPEKDFEGIVLLLQSVLGKMRRFLNDPDLNFFIHTAPLKEKARYRHYHWHIEIIPKLHPGPGGFEVGTKTNINVVLPETAAAMLAGKQP